MGEIQNAFLSALGSAHTAAIAAKVSGQQKKIEKDVEITKESAEKSSETSAATGKALAGKLQINPSVASYQEFVNRQKEGNTQFGQWKATMNPLMTPTFEIADNGMRIKDVDQVKRINSLMTQASKSDATQLQKKNISGMYSLLRGDMTSEDLLYPNKEVK